MPSSCIEADGAFEDDHDNEVEMQIVSDEEEDKAKKPPPPPLKKDLPAPPPLPPTPDQMLIKKNYNWKAAAARKPVAAEPNDQPNQIRSSTPEHAVQVGVAFGCRMLAMTLPLTDTVAVVKAKVHDEVGMPPGKQKLSHNGLFFKDLNTLAYYNITPGAVVQLHIKERGGKKK